ncbi:hypothetical protein A0H81_08247 [Grifola frondosa]|uniref:Aminoglycoside phosphotransferase domain-containing protein n=1 Tax=Grifola frondosa TaxID=5627 RepID=A0A1C7M4Q8_GRIFR|nr:hypothetical protein A0H81_08247 [Grifola frondosa]
MATFPFFHPHASLQVSAMVGPQALRRRLSIHPTPPIQSICEIWLQRSVGRGRSDEVRGREYFDPGLLVDVLQDSGGDSDNPASRCSIWRELPSGGAIPEELSSFEETLRDWFSQLRSLPAPLVPLPLSMVHHAAPIELTTKRFGPFLLESAFTTYLFETVPARYHDEIRDKIERLSPGPHRICFSHGDIHPITSSSTTDICRDGRLGIAGGIRSIGIIPMRCIIARVQGVVRDV